MTTPIRPGRPATPTARPTDALAADMLADDPEPSPAAAPAADASEATATAPEKSPLDRWREAIAKVGLTEDQAHRILDSIVEKGFYQQEYRVFHGRVRVALRTRDSSTLRRVGDALDMARTNDPRVHQQVTSRILLIDSLAVYRDQAYAFATPADSADRAQALFNARAQVVDTLPDKVYDALLGALFKFDQAVFAATSEGDAEAF